MYDCKLIKSRAQRMLEYQLPSLESTYLKMQMPATPGMPSFPTPAPAVPEASNVPSAPTPPAAPRVPATPMAPAVPISPTAPTTPMTPTTPAGPQTALPLTPPESERAFPLSPLLPRVLPDAPNITVPANPLLPPAYASILDYESLQYLNGYLRTQIGNYVDVDFLVGSTSILTRSGRLAGVGLNYILIEDVATRDMTACDFYNIKFLRTHAHGDFASR